MRQTIVQFLWFGQVWFGGRGCLCNVIWSLWIVGSTTKPNQMDGDSLPQSFVFVFFWFYTVLFWLFVWSGWTALAFWLEVEEESIPCHEGLVKCARSLCPLRSSLAGVVRNFPNRITKPLNPKTQDSKLDSTTNQQHSVTSKKNEANYRPISLVWSGLVWWPRLYVQCNVESLDCGFDHQTKPDGWR